MRDTASLNFSTKDCPTGFSYSPVEVTAHFRNSYQYRQQLCDQLLAVVSPLIAEHNSRQPQFGNSAVFTLGLSERDQMLHATLSTVYAREMTFIDCNVDATLERLAGRIELALGEFCQAPITFAMFNDRMVAELDHWYQVAIDADDRSQDTDF